MKEAGVYFLFCKEDDGSDSVYIGEAENVKERLSQHLRDYQTEKEYYYWNTAVVFTGNDLNKALIRYLENRFVETARAAKRYSVLTKNTYRNTVLKESQKAVMEEFIDNVKILINVLGYKIFESLTQENVSNEQNETDALYIKKGLADASGKVTTEGFVVFKGSVINENTQNSLPISLQKLRQEYLKSKKVVDLTTTEDILFSSPTAAANFVLGYRVGGTTTWENKDGCTLKDIESGSMN